MSKLREFLRVIWRPRMEITKPSNQHGSQRNKSAAASNRLQVQKVRELRRNLVPTSANIDESNALSSDVLDLDSKLWSGFSQSALVDLDRIVSERTLNPSTCALAAWRLAGWYGAEADYERAQGYFEPLLGTQIQTQIDVRNALLASYCYVRLNQYQASARLIEEALKVEPENPNLHLAMANSVASSDGNAPSITNDVERLRWVNKIYERNGIAGLVKADATRPLSIGNLRADVPPSSKVNKDVIVSVIVPVHNGENTLEIALDGLLAQTWSNIEIIIVDDHSTDATQDVIARYAKKHHNIKTTRLSSNKGVYTARNFGLELANGEFITVHDADDWSHPQKIELQLQTLLDNSSLVATYSNWARVSDELLFVGKFRSKAKLLDWNPSSIMFRKSVLEQAGAWDCVRFSGDSEFFNRLRLILPDQVVGMPTDYPPLSFGFAQPDSLTASGPTHGRTTSHGVRREYREAANHWHRTVNVDSLKLDTAPAQRPFPVPGIMLPDRIAEAYCDALLIADCRSGQANLDILLKNSQVLNEQGLSIGVSHWPHYAMDVSMPIDGEIRDLAMAGALKIFAPGERVKAAATYILQAPVFQHMVDRPLSLETNDVYAIFDRPPPETNSHLFFFDHTTVSRNIELVTGRFPQWACMYAEDYDALAQTASLQNTVTLHPESLDATDDGVAKFILATRPKLD